MDPEFLRSAHFIDSAAEPVRAFAKKLSIPPSPSWKRPSPFTTGCGMASVPPYLDYGDPQTCRAGVVLRNGFGFCSSKAALLAACGRSREIAAPMGSSPK